MTVTIHDWIKDRKTVVEIDSLSKPRISVSSDVQLIAVNDPWGEEGDRCSANCSITINLQAIGGGTHRERDQASDPVCPALSVFPRNCSPDKTEAEGRHAVQQL